MLRVEVLLALGLRAGTVLRTDLVPSDARSVAWTTELRATLALHESWSLTAGLPYAAVWLRGPAAPDGAWVAGPGDASLLGRFALRPGGGRVTVGIGAGFTFPTGRSVGDPGQATGDGDFVAQLGTGVVVPAGAFDLTLTAADWLLVGADLEGRWVPGANAAGYRSGSSLSGSLFAHVPIARTGLVASVLASVLWRARDDDLIPPPPPAPEAPSGGAWLQLGPVLSFAPAWGPLRGLAVTVSAAWTVWQHVNGEQLAERFTATLGLSYAFRVFKPKKKDAHGHGDGAPAHDRDHHDGHDRGHDPGAAFAPAAAPAPAPAPASAPAAVHVPDVADAVREGRAFALAEVLVPGKVTILDFWADWCEPCTYLDAELRALTARAPDVAVRRIDIVVPESPAAAALGGASLPRVRIYDPAGRLVAETGFDLAAIEAAVAAARAAAPAVPAAPAGPAGPAGPAR